jgi:tetratricopeptide (TPR) repeat protein
VFALKKPARSIGTATSLKGLLAGSITGVDAQSEVDSPAPPRIPSTVPRFEHVPNSQDLAIRQTQLENAISALHAQRWLVIQKEPGSKYEGFIDCIIADLRRSRDGVLPHALHFRCAGVTTGRQFQDIIELSADQSFTLFGKALRENGDCVLILDDLDYAVSGSCATQPTVDQTIEALHDFCPNLSIIRITALGCPPDTDPIRIGGLDVADTRSYLNKAPKPVHLSSTVDYNRVHRVTGGVPIYLDDFIRALDVTDVEGALAQADAQPLPTGGSLHESITREIKDIQNATADDMNRTRALLWTLAILEQGESLAAIKRLDARAPIWPKHASYLQSRGCLESVTITAQFTTSGGHPIRREGDKILRIPRLVRDYVLSIMTSAERQEIVRSVATLYFSDDWRLGLIRMRRRLAIGTEISTHQSGNELAILKCLLQSPDVYFSSPSVAFQLALGYVGQLRSKGFYGEAYEAAKDTLAIVESMESVYVKEETYHIQLLAASCARMVGEREACVKYLQIALPAVRASGVKARLTDALVNLAMALHTLKRNPEATAAAKEILEVAPKDSADYLQAKATLAEIEMSQPDAVRYLKTLATRAKNLGHFTVADNAILEVVTNTDNTEEKLRMLNGIKSRRDLDYNFVRATIRRIETLIDAGRKSELTATDRDDLWFSYHLAYSQRMASIFDQCHRVYWQYLKATNNERHLGELYAQLFRMETAR